MRLADTYLKTVVRLRVLHNKMQVDMAGKPRTRCPLFPVCSDISTASDNKVGFFPALFSDVMPLWFGLIPGGCTKGSAAI